MRGYSMFLLVIIAANLCLIEPTPINRDLKSYVESLTDKNEDYDGYPDMKDFKMPDLKDFKLPDVKEYEMPKDFKMPEMENYTTDSMPDIDYSALEKLKEISIFKKMENITKEAIIERLKSPETFPKEWAKVFDDMYNMLTNKSSIYYQVLKEFNMTRATNAMEAYLGKMPMSCSFCQSLTMYVAVEVKVSKRPIDKIKNVVDSVCSIYPKGFTKDACDLMVKDLKLVVEYINKGVAQNDICLNIKLCDKETIQTMESDKSFANNQDENIDENIDKTYDDDKDENDNDRELIKEDQNEWKEIEDEQTKEKQAEAENQEYEKETEEFLKEEEKEEDKELKEYEGVTDEELEGDSQTDEETEGDSQTDEETEGDSQTDEETEGDSQAEDESSKNDIYLYGKTGKYYVNILKEKFKNIWGKGDPIRQ